jgi:drug/metabolite transporter (DMT)-like permease
MMTTATIDYRRGYPVALLSAALLSTTAIFIRYLTQTYALPALVLAFWRDGLVALTVLAVLGLLRPDLLRLARGHRRYLVVYGLVLALFNAIWVLSVALNGAAISTVLVYSSAAFTVLLGRIFLGEPLDWAKIVAVVFSLGGCVLVAGMLDAAAWAVNPVGIVTGLLSGLWYAIYSLMGRSAAQRGLNPWTTLFYTFVFATGFLLAFNLLPLDGLPGKAARPQDLLWLGREVTGWIVLFLLAAGPTVLGFGLYNVSLSLLPSSVANLILTSEPVFTALIAYVLLDERLTAIQIGGSLLILSGVLLLRLYEGRSTSNLAAASDAPRA